MQGIELKATNGIEAEKNELTWGSLDSFLAKLKSEIFCSINNLGNFWDLRVILFIFLTNWW